MKKFGFLVCALFICVFSQAQIYKGQSMVGGNVNYYKSSNESKATYTSSGSAQNYSQLNLSIRGGYFFFDRVLLGLSYGNGRWSNEAKYNIDVTGQYTQKTSNIHASNSFGVFGRYYKMVGKSKFAVFGQLDAGMSIDTGTQKSETLLSGSWWPLYSASMDDTGISSRLGLGLTYFATPHIAIESYFGAIGYTFEKSVTHSEGNPDIESVNSYFSSNINFNLSNLFLGVNFYFGDSGLENKVKEKE